MPRAWGQPGTSQRRQHLCTDLGVKWFTYCSQTSTRALLPGPARTCRAVSVRCPALVAGLLLISSVTSCVRVGDTRSHTPRPSVASGGLKDRRSTAGRRP